MQVRHKRCGFEVWVGKIPWRRARQPLQYSCLENPMVRGAWWAAVHGVTENQTRLKRLGIHTHGYIQGFIKLKWQIVSLPHTQYSMLVEEPVISYWLNPSKKGKEGKRELLIHRSFEIQPNEWWGSLIRFKAQEYLP